MMIDRLQWLEAETKPRRDLLRPTCHVLHRSWDIGVLAVGGEVGTDRIEIAAVEIAPEALDELAVAGCVTHEHNDLLGRTGPGAGCSWPGYPCAGRFRSNRPAATPVSVSFSMVTWPLTST